MVCQGRDIKSFLLTESCGAWAFVQPRIASEVEEGGAIRNADWHGPQSGG